MTMGTEENSQDLVSILRDVPIAMRTPGSAHRALGEAYLNSSQVEFVKGIGQAWDLDAPGVAKVLYHPEDGMEFPSWVAHWMAESGYSGPELFTAMASPKGLGLDLSETLECLTIVTERPIPKELVVRGLRELGFSDEKIAKELVENLYFNTLGDAAMWLPGVDSSEAVRWPEGPEQGMRL